MRIKVVSEEDNSDVYCNAYPFSRRVPRSCLTAHSVIEKMAIQTVDLYVQLLKSTIAHSGCSLIFEGCKCAARCQFYKHICWPTRELDHGLDSP